MSNLTEPSMAEIDEALAKIWKFSYNKPIEIWTIAWWVAAVIPFCETTLEIAWETQLESGNLDDRMHVKPHDAPFEWAVSGAGFLRVGISGEDAPARRIAVLHPAMEFARRMALLDDSCKEGWAAARKWAEQEMTQQRVEPMKAEEK